ncbi:MAG: zinc-ribbon domain-containing protein, partial [Bradymonadaceae bacterium]
MLIRCPECSTGFRLPEGAIGGEPEKVKCSNCNFVFQVADRDGAVLFDESGDRLPEDAQLDEASPSDTRTPYDRDEDSDVGPKYPDETNTQIGTGPSASLTDDSTADGEQAEEEEADAGSESEGDPGTDQPRQPAGHETSTESEAVERARVPGSSDAGGEDGPDPKETLMGRPVPAEAEGIDTDDETEDPRDTRLGTPKATATTDASDPERHTTERTSPPTPGKEVDDSEASADQTEDDESSDAGRDARKTSDPFPHAEGAPDRDPKETATNLGSGTPAATEGGPAS